MTEEQDKQQSDLVGTNKHPKQRSYDTLLLSTDGTMKEISQTTEPTLEEMQSWVGGYIELTLCKYDGKTKEMIVNEEGLIHSLPINHQGSELVHNLRGANNTIVGNVAVLLNWRVS